MVPLTLSQARRRHGLSRIGVLTAVLAMGLAGVALPARRDVLAAGYSKREVSIPMRDGKRLFTAIYAPTDQSRQYPILLTRTPYSVAPYGADRVPATIGPSEFFMRDGYIVVYQDVRGRWMSEGTFEHMRPIDEARTRPSDVDESTDAYDTIEWLLHNVANHNGRVGMWGISYPGFYAAAGMIGAHPALKAVSPQAPISDWFASDDWHHNGALLLAHAFGWFAGNGWPFTRPTMTYPGPPFDLGTSDGYQFYLRLGPVRNINQKYFKNHVAFWNQMMARDTRDAWWKARDLRPHLRNITPAVLTVGGWFDAENLYGTLQVYHAVERQSPGTANVLVMGPWIHGGWASQRGDVLGDVKFDAPTAERFQEQMELPFFDHYLKDGPQRLAGASVFETGTNRWRTFDAWPPSTATARTLYLHGSGALSLDPPAAAEAVAFDQYVSDPRHPVPFLAGVAPGMEPRYMVEDQRFAARRTDVVTYRSEPLVDPETVAGPMTPTLYVSTSGTDADWIVKLIDVHPDGYQQLVRGEVMRGKFRKSLEAPEPFIPNQPALVRFEMPDILHTFQRGHRLMVQVQSSWFPLLDRNPQTFMNINQARDADFHAATQRIYHTTALPSSLRLAVLPSS